MGENVDLWAEWERLRDDYADGVSRLAAGRSEVEIDAFVRQLIDALHWDRPVITAEDCKLVSGTPALQSVLYDVDLLPEQLAGQHEMTPGLGRAYHRFLGVMLGFRLGLATASSAEARS